MKNLPAQTQGLIAINCAAVIFGSAALYGKLDISPLWIVCMRATFAALALSLLLVLRRDMGIPPRHQWQTLLGTGVILALHWLMFFASVQISGVAIATLTFASFPLFTVLIEAFHHKRKPYKAEITAGVAIVVAVGLLSHRQESAPHLLGVGAGLTSAIAFAWFGYASKRLGTLLSPLRISFVQNIVVGIILMPFLFFVDHGPRHMSDWLWLASLGIFTTALMHQLYFYALRRLSASTCSGFVALEPVYAIVFAAVLFHEPITLWVGLSAFLIIGASLALLKREPIS